MIQPTDDSPETVGFSIFNQFDLLVARIEIGSKKFKAMAGLACATVALGIPTGVVVAGATGNKETKQDSTLQTGSGVAAAVQRCVEYTPSNPNC